MSVNSPMTVLVMTTSPMHVRVRSYVCGKGPVPKDDVAVRRFAMLNTSENGPFDVVPPTAP